MQPCIIPVNVGTVTRETYATVTTEFLRAVNAFHAAHRKECKFVLMLEGDSWGDLHWHANYFLPRIEHNCYSPKIYTNQDRFKNLMLANVSDVPVYGFCYLSKNVGNNAYAEKLRKEGISIEAIGSKRFVNLILF